MAHPDRVVFVTQQFPPDKGGNAARIHDIATHLNGSLEVTVLAPPPSYPPGEFDRSWRRKQTDIVDDVTVHRLWTWQPQAENPSMTHRLAYYLLFGIHAMLWLLVHVRQYDAVVTTTPPISTGAPGLLVSALGIPWIVDVRDRWIDASISLGYLESGSIIERISRRFQSRVLHTADRIAVTTETLGESLSDTYGETLAEKTVHVPNGVDVERFRPQWANAATSDVEIKATDRQDDTSASPSPSAASAEPDGGNATIIYTGNLGTAQDLHSCIHAMSELTHDATLRLVGSGDVESELERLASELGVTDRVEFDGLVSRDEIPQLLNEATVGIAPLKRSDELAYAMPTKLYEYMASGLPVLVTGCGEIERFVTEAKCGVHVENDPKQIATALEELLADERRRREFGKNGRTHVEDSYDRKAIAHRLGSELHELIEGESDT